MKGLELAQKYYEAYGKEMLQQFPHALPYLAIGLAAVAQSATAMMTKPPGIMISSRLSAFFSRVRMW